LALPADRYGTTNECILNVRTGAVHLVGRGPASQTISVGTARETIYRTMQAAARGVQAFEVRYSRPGMSNMRPAGRMRPFASTPAARTKDTVIWSFNGQNCSFYNLKWINVRRSQKNGMLFFIQNVF
jgi:hypothetical protein